MILRSTRNSLVLGDFNIIKDWSAPFLACHSGAVDELSNFTLDFDLSQLNLCPSRGNNVLDLVLVSQLLSSSVVHQMPPFSNCDHKVQVISTNLNKRDDAVLDGVQIQAYQKIHFPMLITLLQQINWKVLFNSARDIDEFAYIFNNQIALCINSSMFTRRRRRHGVCDLLRHIVKLINKKNAA